MKVISTHLVNEIKDSRACGFLIPYMEAITENPSKLIVLMPAALSRNAIDRNKAMYSRFTWHPDWPDANVLAIADPVLQLISSLSGAWFIHPQHDFIKLISDIVREQASKYHIPSEEIVYYGSSLGGFAALQAASLTKGSRAVAEVPQIAFRNWIPGAIQEVETTVLNKPLLEFEKIFPERTDVIQRFLTTRYIPPITLITNTGESRYKEHLEFIEWVQKTSEKSETNLIVTSLVSGHKVLNRDFIVKYIN